MLAEDKKYYPSAEEVYGADVEALVMDEDAQVWGSVGEGGEETLMCLTPVRVALASRLTAACLHPTFPRHRHRSYSSFYPASDSSPPIFLCPSPPTCLSSTPFITPSSPMRPFPVRPSSCPLAPPSLSSPPSQPLEVPIVAPVKLKKIETLEQEPLKTK